MRPKSLAGHLAVRFFIVALAALMALGWYAARAFDDALTSSTWTELEAAANLVAADVGPQLGIDNAAAQEVAQRIADSTHTRITLVTADGAVVFDSRNSTGQPEAIADRPEIAAALAGQPGRDSRLNRNERWMFAATAVRREGKIVGVVRAGISAAGIERAYSDARQSLLVGIGIMAICAGLLGWWLARRTARRLEPLERGALQLASGQSMPKLPLPPIEELAALAAALNRIGQQIEERSLRIGRQGNEQEAVLASMVEGVLAVDSEERILTLNSAAAGFIGGNPADLQGRYLHEVIRNADMRRFFRRALESPDPIEDDVVLHGEGNRILQVRGTALHDGASQSVGAVIVLNDVTHYRRLENLRRDFVANVSHELKTPIASIKGFVETLIDGAIQQPADAERFLKIIASHADRLNNIIEDLLSLSKIEQSEEAANLPLTEVPLRPVLEAALHGCEAKAAERKIQLTLVADDSTIAQLNPPLFEQAIINLVDNAIKYSEPGGEVTIEAQGSPQEIVISVRDRGCGIAAEHLPRLFERFYRVDRARSRKLGGTGLGLAIVKHIVQAHRGRTAVASTPGAGSVFSIHLPGKATSN